MNDETPLINIVCDPGIEAGKAFLMPPDSETRRILAHAPDVRHEDLMKMMSITTDEASK